MFPPDADGPTGSMLKRRSSCDQLVTTNVKLEDKTAANETATGKLYGLFQSIVAVVTSAVGWRSKKVLMERKNPETSSPRNDHAAPTSSPDQKQRLRRVPFTSTLFRMIARRMSIHSWIVRVISRANVPSFERTFTEMPLYSASGDSMGPQKATCEFPLLHFRSGC